MVRPQYSNRCGGINRDTNLPLNLSSCKIICCMCPKYLTGRAILICKIYRFKNYFCCSRPISTRFSSVGGRIGKSVRPRSFISSSVSGTFIISFAPFSYIISKFSGKVKNSTHNFLDNILNYNMLDKNLSLIQKIQKILCVKYLH